MDLIIASVCGRSGSTLVQRIFNSRPKTLIWGEHAGSLKFFCTIKNRLENWIKKYANQRENYFGCGEDYNKWTANLNPDYQYLEEALSAAIRVFFSEYYAEHADTHDLIGFKEILYGYQELILFRKAYPECNILLLVRNPLDIWRSVSNLQWYSLINFIELWNKRAAEFIKFCQEDSKAYLIRYEDIINRKSETINTICKLGRLNPADIDKVLCHKINSTRGGISSHDRNLIRKCCQKNMRKLKY